MLGFLFPLFNILLLIATSSFIKRLFFFGFFLTLVNLSITYLKSLVTSKISDLPLLGDFFNYVSYFGIFQYISIVITYLITGFIIKQLLAYLRG